jgi:hypothetical protein
MSIVNCDSFCKIATQIGNDGIMFNNNILVQAKQEYLDGLFDLYGYQKRLNSFCHRYIKVFATTDKDDLDYVPKQRSMSIFFH